MATQVFLVDDHDIVRAGLRSILEQQQDVKVVGEAGDGRVAVKKARELLPDIVLMDISMPDLNGVEAARQILGMGKAIKVLAISMHADRQFVAELLKAGASGYLLKNSAALELPQALRAVRQGKIYLSPNIAGIVVEDYIAHVPAQTKGVFGKLSGREREVLQLLAEGRTNKEIAKALNVSAKTVETHRAQIMTKLQVHMVAELTKLAIREGLTQLDG